MKESDSYHWVGSLGATFVIGGFVLSLLSFAIDTINAVLPVVVAVAGFIMIYLAYIIDKTDDPFAKKKLIYKGFGIALLLAGISCVLISSTYYLDNKNPITISYLRNLKVEDKVEINRPILSSSPEPPAQPILLLEYALAAAGSVLFLPLLIIPILQAIIIPILQAILTYIAYELENLPKWIILGIAAIIFLCCSIVGIPAPQWVSNITPTPTPSIPFTPSIPLSTTRPLSPDEKVYYALLDVNAPPYIKQGQSHILELKFDLRDKNIDGAIPIILQKANVYTATINTQLVNFDFSSPPTSTQENRTVSINQPIQWQWLVTPKTEAEGKQSIIWTLELNDSNGKKYQDLPTVMIEIQIKPKLGIPSWVLGPNVTLGALVGGFLLNGVGYLIKRKTEKEEREANERKAEREREANERKAERERNK